MSQPVLMALRRNLRLTCQRVTILGGMIAILLMGAIFAAPPAAASASANLAANRSGAAGQQQTYSMKSPQAVHGPSRNANIPGDCGQVNFIRYGDTGNLYVIVDSWQGEILGVDYTVTGPLGRTSNFVDGNGTSHLEFPGHIDYIGGPLLLTGDALLPAKTCVFIPNPG